MVAFAVIITHFKCILVRRLGRGVKGGRGEVFRYFLTTTIIINVISLINCRKKYSNHYLGIRRLKGIIGFIHCER
jgi:hypothetical protein